MRLLLLAISSASCPPFAAADGGPLVRVSEGALAAWAMAHDHSDTAIGRAELIAHHALVSRLHDHADGVLPARFPTWTDEAALRVVLRQQATAYGAGLEHVRGRVELAVTALWTEAPEAARRHGDDQQERLSPGTRYLLQRQEAFVGSDRRRATATSLADELEHEVGEVVADSQRQVCPSTNVALSMALLVARAAVPDVQVGLLRHRAGVRILVNGPWPPYTFAAVVREA
jgi:hypothetical protein